MAHKFIFEGKIFLYKLILLISLHVSLLAGLQDKVKDKCIDEYSQHESIVSKYLIRMEDDIYEQGCSVIPIYASIIESENFEVLDAIEDDPAIMKNLLLLSSNNLELVSFLFQSGTIKEIILNNSLDNVFMSKLIYLLRHKFHDRDFKAIKKNIDYLNYYLLVSLYSKDRYESVDLFEKLQNSNICKTYVIFCSYFKLSWRIIFI